MWNNKYGWMFCLEWFATAILLVGVAMTACNIYPANLYMGLAGNFAWAVLGWKWRKWSLLVIQAAISIIYLAGIISVW
jgi:hypothetical protein